MKPVSRSPGPPRPPVWRVLVADALLLLVAAAIAGWHDGPTGRAVLLGGLIFLVPHAWFSWQVFRHRGAGLAREVAQGFYRAEAGKFLLTAAGFALAFHSVGASHAVYLLGAYVALLVVNGVLTGAWGAV